MSIARVSPVLLPGYRWAYPELRKGRELALHGARGNTGKRWFDESGRDRHGLLTNMDPKTTWLPGALDFDGSDDEVDFPLNFTPVVPITLAARFKPESVSGVHGIFTISDASANRYLGILAVNDGVRAQCSGDVSTDRYAQLLNVLVPDEWYTIAGVFESETTRTVYLDGPSQSATSVIDTGPFSGLDTMKCGVLSTNGNPNLWRAAIQLSFVGIWSRTLLPAEIQLLHDRPNAVNEQRRRVFAAAVAGPASGVSPYYYLLQGAG